MTLEFISKYIFRAGLLIQFDVVVSGNCEGLTVGGEGMVGDGVVEEVENFRTRHGEEKEGDRRVVGEVER